MKRMAHFGTKFLESQNQTISLMPQKQYLTICRDPCIIMEGIIKFGPDGKLYVGTGSVSESSHGSQDIQSLEGKILRLNDDGTIPDDNPFSDSPIFSFGHMNPKGLGWDNGGNLFVTEMGPSKNDEINLVQSGGNYGWPEQECSGNEEFIDPIICYDPAIEPGGIVFYYGDKIKLDNPLVLASLRASQLFNLEIDDEEVKSQTSILSGIGRIRDVAVGTDGHLYLITSNTDGKGFPDASDDKLFEDSEIKWRIHPYQNFLKNH